MLPCLWTCNIIPNSAYKTYVKTEGLGVWLSGGELVVMFEALVPSFLP